MKDVYYFSHDANARRDPKMQAIRDKFGPEGYGIYFMLIEIMSEQHGYKIEKFPLMVDGLARDIGITKDRMQEVLVYMIDSCELLKQDDRFIWSESLLRRKLVQEEKRLIRVEAGRIGGIRSGAERSKTKQNEALLQHGEAKRSKLPDASNDSSDMSSNGKSQENANEAKNNHFTNENEAKSKQNEALVEATNQSKGKERKGKESKEGEGKPTTPRTSSLRVSTEPEPSKGGTIPQADILIISKLYCQLKKIKFDAPAIMETYIRQKNMFYSARDLLKMNGGDLGRTILCMNDLVKFYEKEGKEWHWKFLLEDFAEWNAQRKDHEQRTGQTV
jgi:hypothetical protein